jgi:hypothetical protein
VVAIQQDQIFHPIEKENAEELVVTTAQPNLRQIEMEKVEDGGSDDRSPSESFNYKY